MYEKPEDVSYQLIHIGTPMAVAAIAAYQSAHDASPVDITALMASCADAIQEQFGLIRNQVDDHSSPDHTELLAIKIDLLKVATHSATALLAQSAGRCQDDQELTQHVIQTLEHCVAAICEQYARFQARYMARQPRRR